MPYKDLQKRKDYHRQYNLQHPISPEKRKEYTERYRSSHREALRARYRISSSKRRERRYGLTAERFEKILAEQNGVCACCKVGPPVHVDHAHQNGHFRGLLCRSCNLGLGMFKDDPARLKLALEYLERPTMRLGDRIPKKLAIVKRGQDSPAAKLNDEKVRQMRAEYAAGGVSHTDLSKKYGIHKDNVGRVLRRQDWAHVA